MPVAATAFTREKLLQVARALPADLRVLSELGEVLQDVNSELDQIASLLRTDLALAARIVRIANSPVFGGGGSIASIEDAVNRVGFSEILKLVGTATAARFAERALEHYEVTAVRLRDNMLYTAFACEALARQANFDSRMAYTAGLLRPLGMMVLDRAGRGQLHWSDRFGTSRCASFSAWEGNRFGIDNCEVAGLILEEWRFPEPLSTAIRGHYLQRPEDYQSQLACLVNLANGVGRDVGRALAGEAAWWDINAEKLRGAEVAVEDLAQATESADAAFAAAIAALAA